jgi:outer membrane protein assembly factor BamA
MAVICLPILATAQERKKEVPELTVVKQGWNFGPLPAIGYNSDLGFQLGVLCDIYYYGNGKAFPGYIHKFNVEASYYFKGSGVFHFFYDSKYLIPKVRVTTAVTYLPNPIMNFYGFNGAATLYDPALDKQNGMAFYSMKRNSLRVLTDFQGNISGPLNWAAGMAFWNYRIGEVSLKKYADHASNSLYNIYRNYGVIGENEAKGGSHVELKAGLVYDTRDHEAAPSRGIWAEAMIYGSPDIFQGAGFNYLKMSLRFRQYLPVLDDRIVFAYNLAYQGTMTGQVPFYLQSNITTPYLRQVNSEGLGSVNTLRGMLYNRIVGDGLAWANAEMRFRVVRFRFIKQGWYVALNPFFDAGMVVQPYRLSEMKRAASMLKKDPSTASLADLVYSGRDEKLHASAGLGVKLVMNRNFIVSVEWAKPFDPQDGTDGMNVGLNYIF